jgi:hypothetical protein
VSGENKRLAKLYETVWTETHRIVNAADPEGLLKLGAPDDEYDDAVGMLTRHLLGGKQISQKELDSWFSANYGLRASTEDIAEIVIQMEELRTRTL